MRIELTGALSKCKEEAARLVRDHFNNIACRTLHDDLVALAQGKPKQILSRDKRLQRLLARIGAARDAAAVRKIMTRMDKEHGLR